MESQSSKPGSENEKDVVGVTDADVSESAEIDDKNNENDHKKNESHGEGTMEDKIDDGAKNVIKDVANKEEKVEDEIDDDTNKNNADGDKKQDSHDVIKSMVECAEERATADSKDVADDDNKESNNDVMKDDYIKDATGIEKESCEDSKIEALDEINTETTGFDETVVDNDDIKEAVEANTDSKTESEDVAIEKENIAANQEINVAFEDLIEAEDGSLDKMAENQEINVVVEGLVEDVALETYKMAANPEINVIAEDLIEAENGALDKMAGNQEIKVVVEDLIEAEDVTLENEKIASKQKINVVVEEIIEAEDVALENDKMDANREINVVIVNPNQGDVDVASDVEDETPKGLTSGIRVKRYSPGMPHPHYERDVEDPVPARENEEIIDATGRRVVPEVVGLQQRMRPVVLSGEAAARETAEQAQRRRDRNEANAQPYYRRSMFRSLCYNEEHFDCNLCFTGVIFTAICILILIGFLIVKYVIDKNKSPTVIFPHGILPDTTSAILPTEVFSDSYSPVSHAYDFLTSDAISNEVAEVLNWASEMSSTYISPSVSQAYEFLTSDVI